MRREPADLWESLVPPRDLDVDFPVPERPVGLKLPWFAERPFDAARLVFEPDLERLFEADRVLPKKPVRLPSRTQIGRTIGLESRKHFWRSARVTTASPMYLARETRNQSQTSMTISRSLELADKVAAPNSERFHFGLAERRQTSDRYTGVHSSSSSASSSSRKVVVRLMMQ
mmetsp:Transcript_69478/g.225778  ORF Transcript_69478/g.225778 Transcript_69478/m.225778 type:complete len:172 (-) Transcript_69478:699-1214(-)